MTKRILLIDSEFSVLNALQQVFWDGHYQVMTAGGGAAALGLLEKNPVDLIVSELMMPDMGGLQLLQTIKSRYPDTLRMILSNCMDERLVVRSLMDNLAKIYLYKPWNKEMLLDIAGKLFETDMILQGSKILAIIKSTEELPMLNMNFRKILQLLDEGPSFEEVANAIEQDQSIAGKLLYLANSAYYGLKTGSVGKAVKYLGFNALRNLVISMPIMDCLSESGPDGEIIEKQWRHAALTNSILNQIYDKYLKMRLGEVEGTAGLLHNIGVPFLIKQYRSSYLGLLRFGAGESPDLSSKETGFLGATHAEIGGYLLRWWDLPYPIIEAAIYHHNPLDARIISKTLVQAVHIAQHYAFIQLNEHGHMPLILEVFSALGIDRERFDLDIGNIASKYVQSLG